MKKLFLFSLFSSLLLPSIFAQKDFYDKITFTKADTLRGMLSPERSCYDVTFYNLSLAVDIHKKFIKGFVDIHFKVVSDFDVMQIDLYENMEISEITFYEQPITFHRIHNAVYVHLPLTLPVGSEAVIRVAYEGFPTAARNAPWDGGFVWEKDKKVRPWIGVACEGDGASLWWPCKDHLSDEPDSMAINIAVPDGLTCVSNGNLRSTEPYYPGYTMWKWFVSYPINNYNVSINIASYEHFTDTYLAKDGDSLAIDYYVLDYNLEKAKQHFEQVKPMLACYEHFFGKYPFWNDGFALVETPYLGMEHQSCIAYGNNYNRGYLGGMIPRDMDWDYLIIHESGHEYFGNALSCQDHGDMWIHESFTTYMEALYVECMFSYEDAIRYLEGQRIFIRNLEPLVGPKDVNWDDYGSSDHYFKGSWVLHTFRNVIDNDELWFKFLRDYYDAFKYKTTSTEEFLKYVDDYFEEDYSKFFEQYLFYPNIPRFLYSLKQVGPDVRIRYTWETDVDDFDMPIKVGAKGNYETLHPVEGKVNESILKNVEKSEVQVATELFYVKKSGL